jgi:hypothetical protein
MAAVLQRTIYRWRFLTDQPWNAATRLLGLVLTLVAWLSDWSSATAWAAPTSEGWPGITARPTSNPPGLSEPEEPNGPGTPEIPLPPVPGSDTDIQLQWPDLRTLPPSDFEIRGRPGGRRVLRLANTVWNSGAGALELKGEFNRDTRQTLVAQRVSTNDGNAYDHVVGMFVWHPGHDHWHVEDFAVYELWSLTAAGELERIVSRSSKLSYCLIDTDRVDPEHPGFDARRQYYGCGRALQGLSVGWGDKYESSLDGQSLDISKLADGVYALVSRVNPDAKLLESNYANNTAIVYLNIIGQHAHVVRSPELAPERCQAAGRC